MCQGEDTGMYEILIRIECLCVASPSAILVETGLLILIPAVLLWLAGAYFCTALLGLAGGIAGLVCGFFVSQGCHVPAWLGMATGMLVFAIAALVLRQVVRVILGVLVFAAAGAITYSCLILKQAPLDIQALSGLSVGASLESLETSAQLACLGRIIEQAPTLSERLELFLTEIHLSAGGHSWEVILATILGGMIGLILSWGLGKFMMALCCSAAGTFLMLAGLDVILMGMDVSFVARFQPQPAVLTMVFLSLAGAGVIVQMIILFQVKRRKRIRRR